MVAILPIISQSTVAAFYWLQNIPSRGCAVDVWALSNLVPSEAEGSDHLYAQVYAQVQDPKTKFLEVEWLVRGAGTFCLHIHCPFALPRPVNSLHSLLMHELQPQHASPLPL